MNVAEVGPSGRIFAENVRRLRHTARISLRDLEAKLREAGQPIQASGLLRLEHGKRRTDVDEVVAIAGVFRVTPAELLSSPVEQPEPHQRAAFDDHPIVADQPKPEIDADGPFDQWVLVELMGHRRVAGRVREVQLAGAGFLRLDIPTTDGHARQTQYLSPGAVYALHPTSEVVARAAAGRFRPEPVSRWELPGLVPVRPSPERGDPGYDEWAAEGSASAVDPDPDYGKDLDDEDHDDGPF
jgi:transcriptional regulator with XRE-family HTH domain